MARYFTISHGLRGCYMPDSVTVAMCATRRDLKSHLESDAGYIRNESTVGLSKKQVAWLANRAWVEAGKKGKKEYLPFVAPYKDRSQSEYHYGLFVSVATRAEYLEHEKENENN